MRLRGRERRRRGAAMVEMAIVLPLFVVIFVIGVDFARIYYYVTTIATCALNGATQGSFAESDPTSPYNSIKDAALADASNVNPKPNVTSTTGVDGSGNNYVEVTVSYSFKTIIPWTGLSKA